MEALVSNNIKNYRPDRSLTVDEQLFPIKSRCPFIVFMSNKPDKFCIKFWVLDELSSKYVVSHVLSYLGALKNSCEMADLSNNVVTRQTSNLDKNSKYNNTIDNCFTSVRFAGFLDQRNMTI